MSNNELFDPVSTATTTTMNQADRIITVKANLVSLVDPEHIQAFRNFVDIVHITTFHTYSFLKYMFLQCFLQDNDFDIVPRINKTFFAEVWLSLTAHATTTRVNQVTAERREFISEFKRGYLEATGYTLPEFRYGQQSSMYEGIKIYVAYTNNVAMHFGNHLRRAVNVLLNVRDRKNALREELLARGDLDQEAINMQIRNDITIPATNFKQAIARPFFNAQNMRNEFNNDDVFVNAINELEPILNSYPENYQFQNQSIYYDCKSNPQQHMKGFFRLARLFGRLNIRQFNCFPLRRSFVPCYATIDTKILCQNIFGIRWTGNIQLQRNVTWRRYFDLDNPPFHDQEQGGLKFTGMILTDGVGISVLKKRDDSRTPTWNPRFREEATEYVHRLNEQQLDIIRRNFLVVDPGRRDLLFCVSHASTPQDRIFFRYTKMQQDSVTKVRKYRAILQGLKTPELNEAERQLAGSRSLEVDIFLGFLGNRSENFNILNQHYALLETDGSNEHLHRKFKLHAAINKMKRDQDLVASLVRAFGENTAVIMGNWSAPNARFHEPVRGIGFRALLKRNRFPVFLVDKYG